MTITADDIQRFAEVSGDFNPLHMSDEYAATTMFEKAHRPWRADGELHLRHPRQQPAGAGRGLSWG
jgi:acyl dehydratase